MSSPERVGNRLKSMLAAAGFAAGKGCGCDDLARQMDAGGCEWCEKNRTTIIKKLAREARLRRIPLPTAAASAILSAAMVAECGMLRSRRND